DPHVTAGGLTRGVLSGAGVGTSGTGAARGWGGTNWVDPNEPTAIANARYVTFSITATGGVNLSISGLNTLNYPPSASGADTGELQYQIGAGAFVDAAPLLYPTVATTSTAAGPIDLSGIAALQNVPSGTVVTFRIVNWRLAANGTSGGTWYIFD